MNDVLRWLAIFMICGVIWFGIGVLVAWAFGRFMDVQRTLDERAEAQQLEARRRFVASQNGHVRARAVSQTGADINATDIGGD